eukprot:4580694-Pyramimonas_sp.AAC.1
MKAAPLKHSAGPRGRSGCAAAGAAWPCVGAHYDLRRSSQQSASGERAVGEWAWCRRAFGAQ